MSKAYQGCFIFFGDVRYDSRLQNILKSLSKKYQRLVLFQVSEASERFTFENCDVVSLAAKPSRRGSLKFAEFYNAVLPKVLGTKAAFYCAEDVYSLPVASLAARLHGGRTIYDSREIFFALGSLAAKPLKQKIWQSLESLFIRRATVFTSGELDSDLLATHYAVPTPATVYNFPALQTIASTNALREKLSLSDDRRLLLYQGVLMEGRGLFKMIEVMEQSDEHYALVLIGDGPLFAEVKQRIERSSARHRIFMLGRVPYAELLHLTASADVGLSLIENISKSYELALPNKIFEYAMCGVPGVVSDLPAMKKIVDAHHIGLAVSLGNTQSIVHTIENVFENHAVFKAACGVARLRLNWEHQESVLLSLFEPASNPSNT